MMDNTQLEKDSVVVLATRDGTENKKLFTRIAN
jgi:hypothetical protein